MHRIHGNRHCKQNDAGSRCRSQKKKKRTTLFLAVNEYAFPSASMSNPNKLADLIQCKIHTLPLELPPKYIDCIIITLSQNPLGLSLQTHYLSEDSNFGLALKRQVLQRYYNVLIVQSISADISNNKVP